MHPETMQDFRELEKRFFRVSSKDELSPYLLYVVAKRQKVSEDKYKYTLSTRTGDLVFFEASRKLELGTVIDLFRYVGKEDSHFVYDAVTTQDLEEETRRLNEKIRSWVWKGSKRKFQKTSK